MNQTLESQPSDSIPSSPAQSLEKPSSISTPYLDFRRHWVSSTSDENLTLHGFRRFKTTHLLNLRFLEDEIAKLDHQIYQAGLGLDLEITQVDRLGLKHVRRDQNARTAEEIVTRELILNLRGLIKEYDDALSSFNQIMAMETFCLLDDGQQSSMRSDLTLQEKYKTRLVRVDREPRRGQDPLQRRLHKLFRALRFWRLSKAAGQGEVERGTSNSNVGHRRTMWSCRNSMVMAELSGRFTVAVMTGLFLVVPLDLLSRTSVKEEQLLVISMCLIVFSFVVSAALRTSNLEMMMVSAAYAAVLSVFVSGS